MHGNARQTPKALPGLPITNDYAARPTKYRDGNSLISDRVSAGRPVCVTTCRSLSSHWLRLGDRITENTGGSARGYLAELPSVSHRYGPTRKPPIGIFMH
jgi:hypothetical protein